MLCRDFGDRAWIVYYIGRFVMGSSISVFLLQGEIGG